MVVHLLLSNHSSIQQILIESPFVLGPILEAGGASSVKNDLREEPCPHRAYLLEKKDRHLMQKQIDKINPDNDKCYEENRATG